MKHITSRHTLCALVLLVGLSNMGAHAQNSVDQGSAASASSTSGEAEQRPEPDIASGNATHAWLAAQDKGAQASKYRQTLSGPVMSRVYTRYLSSFADKNAAAPKPEAAASK